MNQYSIVDGELKSTSLAYVIANTLEIENVEAVSKILMWDNGSWNVFPTELLLVSTCITYKNKFVTVAEEGSVLIIGKGEIDIETPTIIEEDFFVRDVQEVDENLYIVGLGETVLKRNSKDSWRNIGENLSSDLEQIAFESIDGFSENELYAVGWSGFIYVYKDKEWKKLDSPTNLLLTKVLCAPNKRVYICGQEGTIIIGRGDKWQQIKTGDIFDDFFDLHWFNNRLYVSSMTNLYILSDLNELELVYFDGLIPNTCNKLSSSGDCFWSIGENDIIALSGGKWKEISLLDKI